MALQPSSNMCSTDASEADGTSNCCDTHELSDQTKLVNYGRVATGADNSAAVASPQQLQMKSSFQITCVVPKSDGDSMDDLDDVTNTEDVSSDVHAADVRPGHWSSAETIHSPCESSPRSPNNRRLSGDTSAPAADVQSRFRIVKVESRAPSRVRGRWTCMDFGDPPIVPVTSSSEGTSTGENAATVAAPIYFVDNALQVPFTPAFVYSGDHLVLERNPLNTLADGNIYSPIAAERSPAALNVVSSVGLERLDVVTSLSELADAVGLPGDLTALASSAEGAENADSSGATFAIDNKIEQAMDLVKSHLMFAVHEEVELLKEQIKDLMLRNAHLEHENAILRAAASPETLARLESTPPPAANFPPPAGPSAPS